MAVNNLVDNSQSDENARTAANSHQHLAQSMHIEVLDRRTMSEPDARAVAELVCAIWPKPGRTVEIRLAEIMNYWKDYDGPEEEHPRIFVVREKGRMIAAASIAPRSVGTTRGDTTLLALARVCTDPAVRGQGLGQAVVREAFDLVDRGPFPFSLFQTSEKVRPFYEKLGAVVATNRFVNSHGADPQANPFWDKVAMRYPGGPGWPEGEIDLRGPGW